MNHPTSMHVGYVVKVYPRYSETFIVNEILAHEVAGWTIDIFSLRPSQDSHFQDRISRVRAPVIQIPAATPKIQSFWETMHRTAAHASGVVGHIPSLDAYRSPYHLPGDAAG